MGAALAAALPDLDYDCGLGTASLLAADVTRQPLRAEHGTIPVRRPEVDESAVTEHAAPADRGQWWADRLTRCHALLAASGA
jgi:O-succinylbenzoate synthase